jgi:uncharacterized protein YegJ (DUF2314 family)
MINNTGVIHVKCAEERLTKLQQDPQFEEKLKNSKFVKRKFSQANMSEHMWVAIESIDWEKKNIQGILANDPLKLTNIKCDDSVECKFSEVSDFILK